MCTLALWLTVLHSVQVFINMCCSLSIRFLFFSFIVQFSHKPYAAHLNACHIPALSNQTYYHFIQNAGCPQLYAQFFNSRALSMLPQSLVHHNLLLESCPEGILSNSLLGLNAFLALGFLYSFSPIIQAPVNVAFGLSPSVSVSRLACFLPSGFPFLPSVF